MTRPARAVVAVGASAGGLDALTTFAAGLPADLPAGVLVVLHVPPLRESALPRILERAGPLEAEHARDGDELREGRIYVAPPDHHLLVRPGQVHVVRGPRENGMRPAIDPLFRSAAACYGPGAIGVVLSGTRDDGAAGAAAITELGGRVVVQDPREAAFPGMPRATIAVDHPDHVVPAAQIAPLVAGILDASLGDGERVIEGREGEVSVETSYAALEAGAVKRDGAPGALTAISCPECGGALWELEEGDLPRFRCRVGHAYSLESALEDQERSLDRALWIALRALLERASLAHRIKERTEGTGSAVRFEQLEREARANADVIRQVLLRRDDGDHA